jgi:DNA-binding MarR family transcriptional regulator
MKHDELDILATHLNRSEIRVLLKLLKQLDYKNLTLIQQKQLAEELEMQKQNVNRAIKRLIQLGIVLKGPRIGKSCSYKLNLTQHD